MQPPFFIQSLTQKMLLHPINPGLEGQDVSALRDTNGVAINMEMLQIAKSSGQGMLQYSWPKPGQSTPADKRSR
ncbi:cache domain-containing protein [Pseudomonas paeninsulae]|uniref:cache domain-containing protein n=1 Tax=Pseudomonas paeninsulae TaxID=3110772 RepID=UPI00389B242B